MSKVEKFVVAFGSLILTAAAIFVSRAHAASVDELCSPSPLIAAARSEVQACQNQAAPARYESRETREMQARLIRLATNLKGRLDTLQANALFDLGNFIEDATDATIVPPNATPEQRNSICSQRLALIRARVEYRRVRYLRTVQQELSDLNGILFKSAAPGIDRPQEMLLLLGSLGLHAEHPRFQFPPIPEPACL